MGRLPRLDLYVLQHVPGKAPGVIRRTLIGLMNACELLIRIGDGVLLDI